MNSTKYNTKSSILNTRLEKINKQKKDIRDLKIEDTYHTNKDDLSLTFYRTIIMRLVNLFVVVYSWHFMNIFIQLNKKIHGNFF